MKNARNYRSISAAFASLIACLGFSVLAHSQDTRQLTQERTPVSEKRIALVIGNGAYLKAPILKNPPNDGRDMAATLKALGFEVTSGINVDQRNFKRLIREFGQKLRAGGSGLFYYAGHGVQSKGHNYLIPVDADIQSEAEVEDSGVDVGLVLNFMDEAQNGLNIVILDACRNNPFARSFRSTTNGLAQVDAPTGTLIAYATAPGTVASDGTEQNGLYTSELLKQMQVFGQSATDTFMRVRAEVMRKTANKQVPWEASSLVGAYYFGARPNGAVTAAPATKIDSSAFELSYWETIKNSTNAEDFKAYLEKYPNGQFVSLANNKIAGMGAAKPVESKTSTETNVTELAFWDSVKNATNAEDYKVYLKKYPQGAFADLANLRIAALENAAHEKKEKAEAIKKSSLEGTVWRGTSPGKDKVYRFYLGPNGEARLDSDYYGRVRGTWRQTDSTIQMDFPDWGEKGKMEATVSGSSISGSWNYGIYRFTVIKQDAEGDEETARISKQFKGDFGINSAFGKYYDPVTIFVYPTFIRIARNPEATSAPKGYSGDNIFECSGFRKAFIEGAVIREIKGPWGTYRFNANSAEDAAAALSAIQTTCKGK